MAITEYLDLKLLASTIVPTPAPVVLDDKAMDEWEKLRKLLRGEDRDQTKQNALNS